MKNQERHGAPGKPVSARRSIRWTRFYQPVFVSDLLPARLPAQRNLLRIYLWSLLVIIPSGMVTRVFELTGVPLSVGGVDVHLTLYLPLLFCIPLVLWLGYFWGAIPAYFSTFFVALMGGMSLPWTLVFSLSNPVGLGVMALIYRTSPLRVDLRDVNSFVGFLVVGLFMSVAGSSGAFIWAYTNKMGVHDFYPIWQGWWLGGFLQTSLLLAPLLVLLGPRVLATLHRTGLRRPKPARIQRHHLAAAMAVTMGTMAAFIFVTRGFSLAIAEQQLAQIDDPTVVEGLERAIAGLSIPHWVALFVTVMATFFAYQAIIYWIARIREANTMLRQRADELYLASTTDPLTGIHNRRRFFQRLDHQIENCSGVKGRLYLLLLDLDHFKTINDQYGHPAGDQVLVSTAQRIKDQAPGDDPNLGRLGGEEFALCMEGSRKDASAVAEAIRRAIQEPIPTEEGNLKITASIGVSELSDEVATPDELVLRADKALYQAKDTGRDRVVWSDSSGLRSAPVQTG